MNKKKNIGFIIFGVASAKLISSLAMLFIFPAIYERMGIPLTPIMYIIILIISLISASILIFVLFRKSEEPAHVYDKK